MRLFKKEPIITFKCREDLLGAIPNPVPASEAIPKWLRKMPYGHGFNGNTVNTVKRCLPFKDAMDMGYILPLWVDLNVHNDGKSVLFIHMGYDVLGSKVFEDHNVTQIQGCPIADTTYGNQPMKIINPWLITTPPGWSCMFIQPINHFDNKLHIITGVVDTDKFKSPVNFPFVWMDKEFNGVIQQGTPLVQIIPFKRTDWNYRVDPISKEDISIVNKIRSTVNTVFINGYRLNYWTPKKYK